MGINGTGYLRLRLALNQDTPASVLNWIPETETGLKKGIHRPLYLTECIGLRLTFKMNRMFKAETGPKWG